MSSNRLDAAISDFEDETLDLSLGERISNLREAITWAAFHRLKLLHKYGKKSKEAEDLEYKQVETWKAFKVIETLYYSQIKQNKMLGKSQDDGMDKDFLKRIKEQKSTIGAIVREIPKEGTNG